MIHAQRITIEEFRGVRKLTVDFKGKNFAICGPNGTGKSGIVDALEFALTGNISRLSGRGTGDLSVKDHAPHVDSRNRPDKARVVLTAYIPSLKQSVTIERNAKTPQSPIITPKSSQIQAVIAEVALHPEFALSRRELIRYVLSTPGDRAKEVQTLLRLDSVEDTRAALQKIANSAQKDVAPLKREKQQASEQLLRALEIPDLSAQKLLTAANSRRSLLGLAPLTVLTSTTSLRDGLTVADQSKQQSRIPKQQAISDVRAAKECLLKFGSTEAAAERLEVRMEMNALAQDPLAIADVTREKFLQSAISMIETEACPVCDTEWDSQELQSHVEQKLTRFREAAERRKAVERKLEPLIQLLGDLAVGLAHATQYAAALTPPVKTSAIGSFHKELDKGRKTLIGLLPLSDSINVLDAFATTPTNVTEREVLAAIEQALTDLPELSQQDAARDYLTLSQERLELVRGISLRLKQAEERASLAQKVYQTYASASNRVLEGAYKHVEKDFSNLYRLINHDDETEFSAQLVPSMGKLGFDVDFYGRGYFPPGAYHSEGHQDGMGLCLYLALMRHLRGDKFTFAVLDDVLMSVDVGHRREVCRLLKEQFPNTQFILTTHDEIWLRHMKTAGLVPSAGAIHFRKWDVNSGPTEWDDRDVWNEMQGELDENDVRGAASLLRHYLEFVSADMCHRLRASVEFRGDVQYQLEDVLPPAVAQYKKLLERGASIARSWKQTDIADAIEARKAEFQKQVDASNLERWQINPAVHYNEWMNLQANEFRPVVDAYQALLQSFICEKPECRSTLYVVPARGEFQVLKCSCSATNVNLARKGA